MIFEIDQETITNWRESTKEDITDKIKGYFRNRGFNSNTIYDI